MSVAPEPVSSREHEFVLLHYPVSPAPGYDDPRYDALKASPPAGCTPADFDGIFGLNCHRQGPTLLAAVADLCNEINTAHGILMTDMGIEKLWEFVADGHDGFGASIVTQLLLMAAERARLLDYTIDDLAEFLRTATATPPAPTE
jgi:hypothetical protein